MNPTSKRWWRRLIVILAIIIATLGTGFVGLLYLANPQLIGLLPVGTKMFPPSSGEGPGHPDDRRKEAWINSTGKSSREVYHFVYERGFDSPICVSAWQDGERYWIRSSVLLTYTPTRGFWDRINHWERTRALPAERWEKIRTMFTKPSVITPPIDDGINVFDGSYWTLESVVDGRMTQVQVQSPLAPREEGSKRTATAEPGLEDFVETGQRMLEYGQVKVREMD